MSSPKEKVYVGLPRMALGAGPSIATLYKWATLKDIELTKIVPGDVIRHPEVVKSMEEYEKIDKLRSTYWQHHRKERCGRNARAAQCKENQ